VLCYKVDDDDLCAVNYIDIVPLDSSSSGLHTAGVKQEEQRHLKVCV